MATAPTLLIGLGGKGSEIIKGVYKLASKEQQDKLRFVVFDTDANELKKIKEEARYMYTVQTSDNMTVGQYLDIDRHARDNWFPVNDILNRKVLTEGAGQVRSISRLAFDATVRNGNINTLHKAIADLYQLNGNDMTQSIRVIVASTIAGGTGSGLILPLGLYLRNYLQVHYPGTASIIRGFFILPEIMYNVIPGEAERNNLKCNAYAVVRELDAFLMKGDGSLPKEYKNLKFEVPRVGSSECDRYDGIMPYDFCFLMDAQQYQSSEKLNSFQAYIDHAAETIYAQSIGPTNARSNSSEDNVIRAICKAGGRNRYCGAGASVMRYPYADVREYIALNWANECMSKEWLKIDNLYKKELEKVAKQKALGCMLPKPSKDQFYVSQIESGVADKDAFCTVMRNETITLDKDEFNEIGRKWEQYIEALKKYVSDHCTDFQDELDETSTRIDGQIIGVAEKKKSTDIADELRSVCTDLSKYNKAVKKTTDNTARSMSISLFMEKDEPLQDLKEQHYEYWLRNAKTGMVVHPNAVRYQLYKLKSSLEKELLQCEADLNSLDVNVRQGEGSIEEIFKAFDAPGEESMFDDKSTEEIEGSAEERIAATIEKNSFFGKLFRKYKEDAEEICKLYEKYKKATDDYRSTKVLHEVLKAAIEYNNKIIKAYEQFFNNFDLFVELLRSNMQKLRMKYSKESGSTCNSVCASPKCFDKILAKALYQGSGMDIPGELNEAIYTRVYQYAMQDTDANRNATKFFDSLCNTTIMDYWRNDVEESYGPLIDLDVIAALEKECEYENDDVVSEEDKRKYAADQIAQAVKLSLPFIEAPKGEQPHLIPACAYSPKLLKTSVGDRVDFVNKELKDKGGTASDEISKNEIVFYQAIYGICAKDLQKFAPEKDSPTLHQQAGDYFKAYYDLVNQISWDMNGRGTVITPHIDKTWHLVKCLPDLDDDNEHEQELAVYRAFVYGLLSDKLRYGKRGGDDGDKLYYTVSMDKSRSDVELKVSNGTPCDQFYELLDALKINPPLVKTLNEAYREEIEKELDERKDFWESKFYGYLQEGKQAFKLRQYSDKLRSIFEIPVIYKYSLPARECIQSHLDDMYEAIFGMIDTYVTEFADEQSRKSVFESFVCEQYNRFKANQFDDIELLQNCPHIVKLSADGKSVLDELNIGEKGVEFLNAKGVARDTLDEAEQKQINEERKQRAAEAARKTQEMAKKLQKKLAVANAETKENKG